MSGYRHKDGASAPVLWDQLILGKLLFYLLHIGAGLIDLVDGHDDLHFRGLRVVDRLHGLGHNSVVRGHHDHSDICGLSASHTHGGKGLMSGSVQEGDLFSIDLHHIGTNVLGDSSCLPGGDVGLPDRVQERGLAVVHMARDTDHRRSWHHVVLVLFRLPEKLLNDIDLAGYEWTPIGNSSKCSFYGTFTGNNHKIKGLYIYAPETENVGLFGIAEGGNRLKDSITGLTVYGSVTGCRFVGGIAGKADYNVFISECGNYADVTALTAKTDKISGNTGIYAGGVAGISVINCYNVGTIKSYMTAGGVTGGTFVATNCYNIGSVTASDEAGAIGSNAWNTHEATNSFSTVAVRDDEPITIVTDEQMRSGEVAYKLGEAFGQEIGKDEHPVLGGMKVLYDEANNRYYNENGGTSGIDVITADEAEGAVYYNLQGVASETPFKGLNIVSLRDGSVRKIFVR